MEGSMDWKKAYGVAALRTFLLQTAIMRYFRMNK